MSTRGRGRGKAASSRVDTKEARSNQARIKQEIKDLKTKRDEEISDCKWDIMGKYEGKLDDLQADLYKVKISSAKEGSVGWAKIYLKDYGVTKKNAKAKLAILYQRGIDNETKTKLYKALDMLGWEY